MHHWLVFVSGTFYAVVFVVGREGERRTKLFKGCILLWTVKTAYLVSPSGDSVHPQVSCKCGNEIW